MPRILRTAQSRQDFVEIEDYISRSSQRNAEMILELLEARLEWLAGNNSAGRLRPELAENVRSWNVHRFVLFYRPTDDGIILLRVLHSSRDIRSSLLKDL